jgi:hypothetical protein
MVLLLLLMVVVVVVVVRGGGVELHRGPHVNTAVALPVLFQS